MINNNIYINQYASYNNVFVIQIFKIHDGCHVLKSLGENVFSDNDKE